jgi:hypothetical protein
VPVHVLLTKSLQVVFALLVAATNTFSMVFVQHVQLILTVMESMQLHVLHAVHGNMTQLHVPALPTENVPDTVPLIINISLQVATPLPECVVAAASVLAH